MAGSPQYINLLAEIGAQPPLYVDWPDLADAWANIEKSATRDNLHNLADIAFSILALETGQTVAQLMVDATKLHIDKNAGYAGADNPDPWANFRLSQAFGVSPFDGVLVRLSDKWSRIQSLRRNPANDRIGESILDTLRDLAAYALIAICLMQEEQVAA